MAGADNHRNSAEILLEFLGNDPGNAAINQSVNGGVQHFSKAGRLVIVLLGFGDLNQDVELEFLRVHDDVIGDGTKKRV